MAVLFRTNDAGAGRRFFRTSAITESGLQGQDVAQAATSTQGAASQIHQLAGQSAAQGATTTQGGITLPAANPQGQDAAQGATSSTGAVSQAHTLQGQSVAQGGTSTTGAAGPAAYSYAGSGGVELGGAADFATNIEQGGGHTGGGGGGWAGVRQVDDLDDMRRPRVYAYQAEGGAGLGGAALVDFAPNARRVFAFRPSGGLSMGGSAPSSTGSTYDRARAEEAEVAFLLAQMASTIR